MTQAAQEQAEGEAVRGGELLDQCRRLLNDAQKLQEQATDDFDRRDALAAIAQQKGILELLGKLLGRLQTGANTTVNVAVAVQQGPAELVRDAGLAAEQLAVMIAMGELIPPRSLVDACSHVAIDTTGAAQLVEAE